MSIQPHMVLEWLAYAIGGSMYWRTRNLAAQPPEASRRLAIAAGAVGGALLGAKLLYALDYWSSLQGAPLGAWFAGKTVIGGLLGGVLGVELAKLNVGWTRSTGDAFVWPVILGLALARLGCQLSGGEDLTYGIPTTFPWGWDYGDGIPRHPTALYEIGGLALIAMLVRRGPPNAAEGDRFRYFMVLYLLLRLALDFLKPPHGESIAGMLVPDVRAGLSVMQWACIAGLMYYGGAIRRWIGRSDSSRG